MPHNDEINRIRAFTQEPHIKISSKINSGLVTDEEGRRVLAKSKNIKIRHVTSPNKKIKQTIEIKIDRNGPVIKSNQEFESNDSFANLIESIQNNILFAQSPFEIQFGQVKPAEVNHISNPCEAPNILYEDETQQYLDPENLNIILNPEKKLKTRLKQIEDLIQKEFHFKDLNKIEEEIKNRSYNWVANLETINLLISSLENINEVRNTQC